MAETKMLEGKVAIVTGAGGGIGREIATAMAQAGARVLIADIGVSLAGEGGSASPAEQTKQIIEQRGGKAAISTESVSEWASAQKIVAAAMDAFGRIDIVVNNAGILRDKMIFNMDELEWDAVIAVHLKGHFNPTRHACAYWRDRYVGKPGLVMCTRSACRACAQPLRGLRKTKYATTTTPP